MGAWVWLLRDVGWEPDYRDVAKSAQLMFEISKGVETHGVISFNQHGAIRILKASDLDKHGDLFIGNADEFIDQIEKFDAKDMCKDYFRGTLKTG